MVGAGTVNTSFDSGGSGSLKSHPSPVASAALFYDDPATGGTGGTALPWAVWAALDRGFFSFLVGGLCTGGSPSSEAPFAEDADDKIPLRLLRSFSEELEAVLLSVRPASAALPERVWDLDTLMVKRATPSVGASFRKSVNEPVLKDRSISVETASMRASCTGLARIIFPWPDSLRSEAHVFTFGFLLRNCRV